MHNVPDTQRSTYLLLGCVSALFFFLQIVAISGLRFVTTYLHAQLGIALGLLGLLAGGLLASAVPSAYTQRMRTAAVLALGVVPGVVFISIVYAQPYFWVSAFLIATAFVPFGYLIGTLYREVHPYRGYAFELLCGVTGFMLALMSVVFLREESSLLAASLIGALIAFWYLRTWRIGLGIFFVLVCVLLYAHLRDDRLNFVFLAKCDLSEETAMAKLICLKAVPHAYAPLRSLGSVTARVDILALQTYDGPLLSTAFAGNLNDAIQPFPPEAYLHDARIPDVVDAPRTLILGAGAEGVVKAVRADNAVHIDVVELNGAIVRLWENDDELNEYAQYPFASSALRKGDGRRYLATTEEQYDLITMMNTHRLQQAGMLEEPNYLHTEEAFAFAYERLTDEGVLVIEERYGNPSAHAAALRVLATVRAALAGAGVAAPEAHIAIYAWGSDESAATSSRGYAPYIQIVVSKQPIEGALRTRLLAWAEGSGRTDNRIMAINAIFYEWLWLPGVYAREEFVAVLDDSDASAHLVTDRRPFILERANLESSALGAALYIFGILLAFALGWWAWGTRSARALAWPLYFSVIGVGYMLVEILFIGYLQLYTGSVLVSTALGIGGMLSASATGGWLAHRYPQMVRTWIYGVPVTLAASVAIPLYVLPQFDAEWVSLQPAVAVGSMLLAGFTLGPFFPYGVARTRTHFQRLLPVLVGINGSALAFGVPLGLLLAVGWGYGALALGTVLLYSMAVAIAALAH